MQLAKIKIQILFILIFLGVLGSYAQSTGRNVKLRWDNGGKVVRGDFSQIGNVRTGSSADLQITTKTSSCLEVKWAGLYWSGGIGVSASATNTCTFVTPDGVSHRITADEVMESIFGASYVTYNSFKDVTSILKALGARFNNGTYTVNDIYTRSDWESWSLIVVYEDVTSSEAKRVYIYDGCELNIRSYAGMQDKIIPITGFQTPPAPASISARIGLYVGAGNVSQADHLYINNVEQGQGVAPNKKGDFMDGSITYNHSSAKMPRNPVVGAAVDLDVLDIPNPGNTVIKNGDNSLEIKFSAEDAYITYAVPFSVDAIFPKLETEKMLKSKDASGVWQPINGGMVPFDTDLVYEIKFRNNGNDDAKKVLFEDVFPFNIKLDTDRTSPNYFELDKPVGATLKAGYPKDTIIAGRTHKKVIYDIDDALVRKSGIWTKPFRFKVQSYGTCAELRNVCSNVVQNQVIIRYKSDLEIKAEALGSTRAPYHQEGSFPQEKPCANADPEPTTFYLVDGRCRNPMDVFLCGLSTTLDGGEGYKTYSWTEQGSTTVLGTGKTLNITKPGTYVLQKTVDAASAHCNNVLTETFVVRYDSNQAKNPLLDFVVNKNVVDCINDGKAYVQVPLCGNSDRKTFNLSSVYPSGTAIKWYKYTGSRDIRLPADCPTPMTTVNRAEFDLKDSDPEFTVDQEGEYAVEVTFGTAPNTCSQVYYFRVTKSNYDYNVSATNIYTKGSVVCENGEISISGITGTDQQYMVKRGSSIVGGGWTDILAGQVAKVPVDQAAEYTILVRQKVAPPLVQAFVCEYEKRITVNSFDLQGEIILDTTPIKCPSMDLASGMLRVRVSGNVKVPYNVEVRKVVDNSLITTYSNIDDTDTNPTQKTNLSSLVEGNYKVILKSGTCTIEKPFQIEQLPTLEVVSITPNAISCVNTDIRTFNVVVRGGELFPSKKYHFDVYQAGSTTPIDPGKVTATEVSSSNVTVGGKTYEQVSFLVSFEHAWATTDTSKDYKIDVLDRNGCTISKNITIKKAEKPTFKVVTSPADCNLTAGKIVINLDNPVLASQYTIKYSIRQKNDDGSWQSWRTYQNSNEFSGLTTGEYETRIQYSFAGGVSCYYPEDIEMIPSGTGLLAGVLIPNPNPPIHQKPIVATISDGGGPIRAFVGVIKLACHKGVDSGATIRVSNISGGEHIGGGVNYQIKFANNAWEDDVNTFTNVAPGTYTIQVRGKNGNCVFTDTVTVEPPLPFPNIQSSLSYDCEGRGVVTLTPDNINYDYSYDQTAPVTWQTTTNPYTISNKYTPGTHTIKVFFKNKTISHPNILINENFGAGKNVSNPHVFPAYVYKASGILNDGEYSVTSLENNNWITGNSCWTTPRDHSGLVEGRYLAMNVGDIGYDKPIYYKVVEDVLPDQPIKYEMYVYNLCYCATCAPPQFKVRISDEHGNILDNSGSTVAPRLNGNDPNAWELFQGEIPPLGKTKLRIEIVSMSNARGGNDLAVDDIYIYQPPKVCEDYQEVTFTVAADKFFDFDASSETKKDVTCHGGTDGSYNIEVKNFDTTTGFKYRLLKGSVQHTPPTAGDYLSTSTALLSFTGLTAGNYRLEIKFDDTNPNCLKTKNFTINEPGELKVTLNTNAIDDLYLNCGETQRQVRVTSLVNVVGGTAPYKYELTNLPSNVIPVDSQGFAFLTEGNYELKITDTRNCNTTTSSKTVNFEVKRRQKPQITLTRETCPNVGVLPSGTDVKVVVTPDANSVSATLTYQIKLNTDSVYTTRLSNSSVKSYIFNNLTAGTYDIKVEDQYGCSNEQQITVYEPFGATAQATPKHKCGVTETSGRVTVTPIGGSGSYEYAYMSTAATPANTDFITSSFKEYTYNTTKETVYVWVKDTTTGCKYQITNPLEVNATPATDYSVDSKDPDCSAGEGSLVVTITQGAPSYTIVVTDNVANEVYRQENTNATTFTINRLIAGDYTIRVIDVNACEVTKTVTITDPVLEGTIEDINNLSHECNPPQSALGFRIVDATSAIIGYTIKYSKDNGATWETSHEFMNIPGGATVYPAIGRFKGTTLVCKKEFGAYVTKIVGGVVVDYGTMTPTTGCVSSYDVPVKIGTEVYEVVEYALDSATATNWYSGDMANRAGGYPYTFTALIPGRSYTIYARYKRHRTDVNYCLSSTSVDLTNANVPKPSIKAVPTPVPVCDLTKTNGEIQYALTGGANIGNVTYELLQIDPVTGNQSHVMGVIFAPATLPSYDPALGATIRVTNVPTSTTTLYYLKITEATGGCVSASPSIKLEKIAANPINFTTTPVTLNCKDNGIANLQATGGSGNGFTFVILKEDATGTQVLRRDIRSNDSNVALNLSDFLSSFVNTNPTTVTLRVKAIDILTRCEELQNLVVNFTPKPTFTTSVQNCNLPYRITINVVGTGTYRYSIDGGRNWFPQNILDVPVGFTPNRIRVLDVTTGCIGEDTSATSTLPIVFPAFVAGARLSAMPATCTDKATISINIESGSSDYEYVIFDKNNREVVRQSVTGSGAVGKVASTQTQQVDADNTYRVEIIDKKRGTQSCATIRQDNIVVEALHTPLLEFEVVPSTCMGVSDGQIIAKIKKATHTQGAYTFLLDNAIGTQSLFNDATYTGVIFTGLLARVAPYEVKVLSKYGCSAVQNVTVTEPTPLVGGIDVAKTDVQFACGNVLGENKVRLTLKASGGTAPYRFSIDNINWVEKDIVAPATEAEHTFEIRDIGVDQTITWYITDANRCNVQTGNHNLHTRSVITSAVDLTLDSSTGRMKCGSGELVKLKFISNRETTLGYEVTMASGPTGAVFTSVVINPTDRTVNAPGAHTYEKVITLPQVAGNYTLTITDKDTNCTYTSVNYLVRQIEKPTLDITAPKLCFGESQVTINLNFKGNVGSGYTYNIYKEADPTTPIEVGISTPSHTFTPAAPVEGNYRVVATMVDTGCTVESFVTILVAQNPLDIKAKIVQDVSYNCATKTFNADGIIEVSSVSGGWGVPYLYALRQGGTAQTAWSSQTRYENLVPDTYEILVKDANECEVSSTTIVLNTPTQLTYTGATPIMETPVTCFGDSDGTITLTGVTGGSGTYSYTLYNKEGQMLQASRDNIPDVTNPGKFVKGQVKFENLSEGEYRIRITDELFHCSNPVEVTARIDGPMEIRTTASIVTYPDCGVNGDIKVVAAGGNSPFNYTYQRVDMANNPIGASNTTGIFTGIIDYTTRATYKFLVTDGRACRGYTNVIAIEAVDPLTINVVSVDDKLKCNGDHTGRIVVSADGGSADKQFLYELLDGTGNAVLDSGGVPITSITGIFENLQEGTYRVKVTKGANCTAASTTDIIIKANPIYTANAHKTDITCNGLNDGNYTITLNTTPLLDGTARKFEYAISPRLDRFMSFTGNSLEITNLEPGDYVIIVQDQNGCRPDFGGTDVFKFSILEPPVFSVLVTSGSIIHEGCKGASNGEVKFNITGGKPYEDTSVTPVRKYYKYSLTSKTDDTTYQEYDSSTGIKNLPAGTNTIWVKDQDGCEPREMTVVIDEGVDLQESVKVEYTCSGTNVMTNKVTVSVNPNEIGNVVYYSPTAIPATSSTNPTNNPQFVFPTVIPGSPAQAHTIYVVLNKRNHQKCEVPIHIMIEDKGSLSWDSENVTHILCNGESTGRIEVNISGGSGNYEYAIAPHDSVFTASNVFENLSAGLYPIIVRDVDYDCVITKTIKVDEPAALNISNLTETALICANKKEGKIFFTPEGGQQHAVGHKYTYEVYPLTDPTQKVSMSDIDEKVTGEVEVRNLSAGRYVLKIVDANNCSIQRVFEIENAPDLENTKVQLVYTCGKPAVYGEAQTDFDIPTYAIWVTFPTQNIDRSLMKYTLKDRVTNAPIGGVVPQAFTRFDSNDVAVIEGLVLPDGEYIIMLHYGSCPKELRQNENVINVRNYSDMIIDDVTIATEENTIRVTVKDGKNEVEEIDALGNRVIDPVTGNIKMKKVPYNVYFANPKYTLVQDLTTKHHQHNAFLPDPSNTSVSYLIQKGDETRFDANGKEYKRIRVYVEDAQGCGYYIDIEKEFVDIEIPNYFTPNGDGDNDIWYPKHIENYPNALIQIYDRYGRPIAKLKSGQGWNGKYKGKELPTGDYWYIVNLNEPDDERVFKGHFTLYR